MNVLRLTWIPALIVMAVLLVAGLSCGAAEETTEAQAPQAPQAPQAAAPAAKADAGVTGSQMEARQPEAAKPAAPAVGQQLTIVRPTPRPAAAEREAPKEQEAGFKYVGEPEVPGIFWDFEYTGPVPTTFGENPKFAEMVKAGQLPPVEERLPEEVKVVKPPHGIGVYGGIWRVTATGGGPRNGRYWDKKNGDEVSRHIPHVGFFTISEDGRTYTYRNRRGLNWSDGAPLTMEDVRFSWEDVNFNDTLHETPQGQWLDAITGERVKFAIIDDLHWTLTFDSPDFTLMEGEVRAGDRCTSFYFCFYSPAHYMKQFHEDYADAAALKKLIDEEEAGDWPRLWGIMNNAGTHIEKARGCRAHPGLPVGHAFHVAV